MDPINEQRLCIKFCASIGKSATETIKIIHQDFEDQRLGRTQDASMGYPFEIRSHISRRRRTHREAHKCSNLETVARIQELIHQDQPRTICEIAEVVEVGYGTSQRVLTEEFGIHRVAAKFLPRILTCDQKQQRVNIFTEIRQLASDYETFLSRDITGDENWVCCYDPEKKRQCSQWKRPTSPRPKKVRQV